MKLILDRFEEGFAVCEIEDTKEMINLDISLMPPDVICGDCLDYENEIVTINVQRTKETLERIKNKMRSLWE